MMKLRVHLITLSMVKALAAAATLMLVFMLCSPVQAADTRSLRYDTIYSNIGVTSRNIVYDAARDRIIVLEDNATDKTGAFNWFDVTTNTVNEKSVPLDHAQPEHIAIDEARDRLYILHYRTEALSVIQLSTNTVLKTITGMPKWAAGIALNSDTGNVYVWSKEIIEVDPESETVSEPVKISHEKYPRLKDAVYDSESKFLWIAEGNKSIITAFDTQTKTWKSDVAIPVSSFKYNDEEVTGQTSMLAFDPTLYTLYVAVTPRSADKWTGTKLISINTSTGKHIGEPILLGDTVRQLLVNPATHELYASAGFDNKVQLIDPATWTVTQEVDFNTENITKGTGTAAADTWGITLNATGTTLYASHPYTNRLSALTLSGTAAPATIRQPAPGQDDTDSHTPPINNGSPWQGPDALSVEKPSETAIALSEATFTWGVSEYAQGWEQVGLGNTVKVDEINHTFTFSEGTGWLNLENGTTQIGWSGGFSLRPYAGLVPSIRFLMGNPLLTMHKDGSGSVTMDVSTVDPQNNQSEYKRVTVANFAAGTFMGENQGETVSVTGRPEYANKSWPQEFVDIIPESMKAWWFSTGASLDPKKPPAEVRVAFRRPATSPDSEEESNFPPFVPIPLPILLPLLGSASSGSSALGAEKATPAPVAQPEHKPSTQVSEQKVAPTEQTMAQKKDPQSRELARTGVSLVPLIMLAMACMLGGAGVLRLFSLKNKI
ncbi:YncE family protein [Corynebacterium kutscheri]|nr:YncE family protein [Corynebacterium kutscheri]